VTEGNLERATVCVVGLGYVGWPLAEQFSRHYEVIGFDTSVNRVAELNRSNHDPHLVITSDPETMGRADFIIITVPTPVTRSKEPDLSYLMSATRTIGQNMKSGCTVILESTVYPGLTEEVLLPVLEECGGFKAGRDFKVAYSPERMNPGDTEHSVDRITKIVSGMDQETTDVVAELYGTITPRVYRARDIRTAEAAKVIENIQRDLNIALANELSLIFERLGLNTRDVLEAAATKWNFSRYSPGLVGGLCIPVNPHYLVFKAKEVGYYPQVILAGRAINDYMPKHVAEMAVKELNNCGKVIKGSRVLIMGVAYKENVSDIREAPVRGIIEELREYGVEISGFDPLVSDIARKFGLNEVTDLGTLSGVDCIIVTVAHDCFRSLTLDTLRSVTRPTPVLVDVRGMFDRINAQALGFRYRTL